MFPDNTAIFEVNLVKNPLKSYTLPINLSYPLEKSQNPTDKPNYKIPNRTYIPFTPAGYLTSDMYLNSNYEESICVKIVRLAHFSSFETTHNAFHIIFGGLGGIWLMQI
ncbi:25853_t:CDS:2 [Gigaspora rosea]|nr:25853_t:CDS:2 [Gigaspora rosea]